MHSHSSLGQENDGSFILLGADEAIDKSNTLKMEIEGIAFHNRCFLHLRGQMSLRIRNILTDHVHLLTEQDSGVLSSSSNEKRRTTITHIVCTDDCRHSAVCFCACLPLRHGKARQRIRRHAKGTGEAR